MKRLLASLAIVLATGGIMSAADVPMFPGGEDALATYITENLKYPPLARDHGIEGNVSLSFIVEADGSISSIKIDRMIDPDLEAEAIRIVKFMPAWEPATPQGTAVAAPAHIVVPFRLD